MVDHPDDDASASSPSHRRVLPTPASPLTMRTPPCPSDARLHAALAVASSEARPTSGDRSGTGATAAGPRTISSWRASVSAPDGNPTSASAAFRRSNWRSAAERSPASACLRISERCASSSVGSSATTSSHRPRARNPRKYASLSRSRAPPAHSAYRSSGNNSPLYSAGSPSASKRSTSVFTTEPGASETRPP